MVKPGGTGRPARVISATPAPLPPRRSRIAALPSSNRYTHLCVRGRRARPSGLTFFTLAFAVFAVSCFFFAGGRRVRTAIKPFLAVVLLQSPARFEASE